MRPLYILHFTKDLENQEVPSWPRDFQLEVPGFVVGFSSCFSEFELPGFVSAPVLELFKTSWFCSGS